MISVWGVATLLFLYQKGFDVDPVYIWACIFVGLLLLAVCWLMSYANTIWVESRGVTLRNGRFIPVSSINFEHTKMAKSIHTFEDGDLELGSWQFGRSQWAEILNLLESGKDGGVET